jgi:hypothetical protein
MMSSKTFGHAHPPNCKANLDISGINMLHLICEQPPPPPTHIKGSGYPMGEEGVGYPGSRGLFLLFSL